ncbi:GPR endopeptidase [Paenibacillus sp. D51F]|uniref:GPR endopeptidase n=1 Tax=unclassified Paenibacillus TaxID=185978 RepID=UPI000955EAAD|nr:MULTISPECIES: GPR endopeptidase [unclassified Paenibacillus]ASS66049.1 GPR endopeptidase [Paenibacillus sp. RUD330]SIQ14196.1 spore protease [Paenibacillus sp. RU4X]SIQ36046.1 spore protease [Paenibacillus sp. RU4T]
MNHDLDLGRYAVHTDLALEAKQMAEESSGGPIPGVHSETTEDEGITITRLTVENEAGSRAIGKVMGKYVTFEVPELRTHDSELGDRVATSFAQEFERFLQELGVAKDANVLIVGLGNWNVTPDALGPLVVENTMVTRQFFELMPDQVAPGYRCVSAVAPGVLGITGIESSEIIQSIAEKTKPGLIIAIDALASRSLDRVNTTIQIADTGIHPGSGIGNKRKGLTKEILGVPVIAIGVPTVVYASTVVSSAFDMMKEHFKQQAGDTGQLMGMLDQLGETERLMLVKEVLSPLKHDLLVTPKEIDQFIEDIANVIASGLNAALHDAVDSSNVAAYTH